MTEIGFTGSVTEAIAVNLGSANLRQSSASLTGQLVNPGIGILKPGEFSPPNYPGLEIWLDASAEEGVDYNISSNAEDIPWTKSVQEVVST